MSETKKCPYCAETIKVEAILCRYCGKELPGYQEAASSASDAPAAEKPIVRITPAIPQKPKAKRTFGAYLRNIVIVTSLGGCCACSLLMIVASVSPNKNEPVTAKETFAEEALELAQNDTATPTKIPTNTPTPRPSATATATHLPETATAISANMTSTEAASIVTATHEAYWQPFTATAEEKSAYATKVAQYGTISRNELITYSDNHIGERIVVKGRVFNINNTTEIQIWLDLSYDPMFIIFDDPISGVYEDDWITVYGIVSGELCGTNAFGGQVCQPSLLADFYELGQ